MSSPPPTEAQLEIWAQLLESTGHYRVLRRLETRKPHSPADDDKLALFVDVETTGLDARHDEIIELAMVPFWYDAAGELTGVGEPFHALREPSRPLPPKIVEVTGLTDELLAGHSIDPNEVGSRVAPASLVIAHNANFDRRFLETFCEAFRTKPWACSQSQVPWSQEGFEGSKLTYLAHAAGFFYDKHRAVHDCLAAIELLRRPLPKSARPAMAHLLEVARRPTWRIWAEQAPFDLKEVLKARGYKWQADEAAGPRAWFIDVEDQDKDAELTFLEREIYRREMDLRVRRIDAFDRFSDRC